MAKKYWNNPEFKKLCAHWYGVLAQSGFEDIEGMRNGRLILLKSGTENRYERSDTLSREARAEYFQILGERLSENSISDPIELEIMTLYAQGVRQVEIRAKLSKPLCRSTIYKKLYKWLKIWKLK